MDDYDYGYEDNYGSDGEKQDEDETPENRYYNAKGSEDDGELDDALKAFEEVVEKEAEEEKGEWGFKALKHIVRILFKNGKYKEMMKKYKELLGYIKDAVTRNLSDKVINSLLDFVATGQNLDLLLEFYQATLDAARSNERLYFKTSLKLARLWFEKRSFDKVFAILVEAHKSCQQEDGTDDPKKSTQLLEVYALEIQCHGELNDFPKLQSAYQRCLRVKNAIPSPAVNGVIKEAGGKVNAHAGSWNAAFSSFFDAFHSFDEAGQSRRLQNLKYLCVANMMMLSNINPFESAETRPYKENAEIAPMVKLVAAFQAPNVDEFEQVLKEYKAELVDPFMESFVPALYVNVRTQMLLKVIQPYTTVRIDFLAKALQVSAADVESMLVSLVLDCRVDGRIDQINKRLLVATRDNSAQKYNKLSYWVTQIGDFQRTIAAKVN
eukprot:TRINITY_DN13478_c0_g1_i1.p1 TRINITY_DN13478_c0_g1~~TRINITY_DN13478_c0_g1_i1.p1  ORF type:complete len:459 (+),score=134.67 TRINITY_DN13478_c0_g1_i1:69-1379(+)